MLPSPPQITKNRADFSIFHNTDSQLTEATMHSYLVMWWWCRRHIFFPSTKNSSCPKKPTKKPNPPPPSHYLTYTEHCCYTESLLFWYLTWPLHRIRLFGTPETCWTRSHHYPRRCIVYSWDWKAGQPDISHIKKKQGSKRRLHVDADE